MQGVASVVQIFLLRRAIASKVIDVFEFGKVNRHDTAEPNSPILICSRFRIIYNDPEHYKPQNLRALLFQ